MTAASVLWSKVFWSWALWASIAGLVLSGFWLFYLWMARPEKEMVTPPDKPKGSTGIYLGPGAKGGITDGNVFIGLDNGIVDHGEQNQHRRNVIIGNADLPPEPPYEK